MKRGFSLLLVCILLFSTIAGALADSGQWACQNCGRQNGTSRETCWNCGLERTVTTTQSASGNGYTVNVSDLSMQWSYYKPYLFMETQRREGTKNTKTTFVASEMTRNAGRFQYGMYLKYTNQAYGSGIPAGLWSIVVFDPNGDAAYRHDYETTDVLKSGWYTYWDFYNITEVFTKQVSVCGGVIPGNYTLTLFFEGQKAGEKSFTVKR